MDQAITVIMVLKVLALLLGLGLMATVVFIVLSIMGSGWDH